MPEIVFPFEYFCACAKTDWPENHQNFYNQFINLDFYESYNEKFRAGSLNDINLNLEYDFKQKFNLKKLSAELKFSNSRFADSNKIFKISFISCINQKFFKC